MVSSKMVCSKAKAHTNMEVIIMKECSIEVSLKVKVLYKVMTVLVTLECLRTICTTEEEALRFQMGQVMKEISLQERCREKVIGSLQMEMCIQVK